ncbi:MAG: phosphotransferase [Pseudomonadota bacterium]
MSHSSPERLAAVRTVEIEDLGGAGKGFMSGVARVALTYDNMGTPGPASVVVKLMAEEGLGKDIAMEGNVYARELMFYRSVAPRSPIRLPKCYYTVIDAEADDYAIVMEDAAGWYNADDVKGMDLADAEAAIRMIARFHARWWQSPDLATFDWVPTRLFDDPGAFAEFWPGFCDRHDFEMEDRDRAAGERIAANGEAIAKAMAGGPRTLAHGDFRAGNIMLTDRSDLDRVMVIDWQWMSRIVGVFDVARLACGSLTETLARADHERLVGIWHQELTDHGVIGYSFSDAWADYLASILQFTYVPVACHTLFSHEGKRSKDLLHAFIRRSFHAVAECQALDRLG